MKLIFSLLIFVNTIGISQEYLDFFKSNMLTSNRCDSSCYEQSLTIVYFDSANTEMSRIHFNSKKKMEYYQCSPEYYFTAKNSLKLVHWDNSGNLIAVILVDSSENETSWRKRPNGEISIFKQNADFIGTGLLYYTSGELKLKCNSHKDSTYNLEFFKSGAVKKKFYTYKLSDIQFDDYLEFDSVGNIICKGEYYNKAQLKEFIDNEDAKGKSVYSGVKHGEWRYFDLAKKLIRTEFYIHGILVSTNIKRSKKELTIQLDN